MPIGQKGKQQSLADHTATATALSKEATLHEEMHGRHKRLRKQR
jgi:hypothetical protein